MFQIAKIEYNNNTSTSKVNVISRVLNKVVVQNGRMGRARCTLTFTSNRVCKVGRRKGRYDLMRAELDDRVKI